MPRRRGRGNPTFQNLLSEAQADLWNAWKRARSFKHSGVRGDEREEAVRRFLRERLPGAYDAVKGEAIDYYDTHSTQLDVAIYDRIRNCPLLAKTEQVILPAEALLSVVEVKSVLTLDELKTCFEAAKQLRNLRPYKMTFVDPRADGTDADDKNPRCFYSIFAYDTNLGADDWLSKEWKRVQEAAEYAQCELSIIDRILILNRGIIIPIHQTGKMIETDPGEALLSWFLHLVNFLSRENRRRRPVDLELYSRSTKGWKRF